MAQPKSESDDAQTGQQCNTCHGSGLVDNKTCTDCQGKGSKA